MSSRTPEVSRSCLSCRLLSGGALLLSSGFVYRSARKAVSRGTRVPVGTGLQLVFAADEFCFVERLIPPTRVPSPPKHNGPTPSGWAPPSETPPSLPYMIRRSRMHNIPVYSDIKHGSQKSTVVRKVEGDIWAFDKDAKEHLRQLTGREPPTKVNEVTMSIRIKGQFDMELKEWLLRLGF
ncbi:39S ribosomal protein L49, mitochondrial [Silurus meridionalis]|nr:39S ribosomal protein L49, mitochondrial [Silurus meridionalis]